MRTQKIRLTVCLMLGILSCASLRAQPVIDVTPSFLEFLGVSLKSYRVLRFRIENTGTAVLTTSILQSGSPLFSYDAPSSSQRITPGEHADVLVTFRPGTTLGSLFTGTLIVDNNAGPPATVALFGSSVPEPRIDYNNRPTPFETALDVGAPKSLCVDPAVAFDPRKAVILELTADLSNARDFNVLISKWGGEAHPRDFDDVIARSLQANQRAVLPTARDQELCLLVYGSRFLDASHNVDVVVELVDIALAEMTPSVATGDETIAATIHGGGFDETVQFSLVRQLDSATVVGTGLRILDAGTAEVSFPLGSLTEKKGALQLKLGYDLVADKLVQGNPTTAVLRGAFFQVFSRRGPELEVKIDAQSVYRVNQPRQFSIRYRNIGDVAMPAPLFKIVAPCGSDTKLRLPGQMTFHDDEIQTLGIKTTPGNQGILPANSAWYEMPILFQAGEVAACGRFQVFCLDPEASKDPFVAGSCGPFGVDDCAGNPAPASDLLDWNSLDPPAGSEAVWDVLSAALETSLGTTWSEYHVSLSEIATRLGPRDRQVASIVELFRFASIEALNRPTLAVTGVVRDDQGTPLRDETVVACRKGNVVGADTTDADGRFVVEHLTSSRDVVLGVDGFRIQDLLIPAPNADGDILGADLIVRPERGAVIGGCTLVKPVPRVDETNLPEEPLTPPHGLFTLVAAAKVKLVDSVDPNEKEGPIDPGDDPDLKIKPYIEANEEVTYTVRFENVEAKGTAAAVRHLEIDDTLDQNFDPDTFRFNVFFVDGAMVNFVDCENDDKQDSEDDLFDIDPIPIPCLDLNGCSEFVEIMRVAFSDTEEFCVKVSGSFDGETVKWVFETLNLESLEDDEGFLPVAVDDSGKGQGLVSFSVTPTTPPFVVKETDIDNSAVIRFDPTEEDLKEEETSTITTTLLQEPDALQYTDPPNQLEPRIEKSAVTLDWDSPSGATDYEIYLWPCDGVEQRPDDLEPLLQETTDFSPQGLEQNQIYCWQIVAFNHIPAVSTEGEVWIFQTEEGPEAHLLPGDVNADGHLDVSDPVTALLYLFGGLGIPECYLHNGTTDLNQTGLLILDFNGDVKHDLTDAVASLNYLFTADAAAHSLGDDCHLSFTGCAENCE